MQSTNLLSSNSSSSSKHLNASVSDTDRLTLTVSFLLLCNRSRFAGNVVGSTVQSFEQVILAFQVAAVFNIFKLIELGSCSESGQQHTQCAAAQSVSDCTGMLPEMLVWSARMEVQVSVHMGMWKEGVEEHWLSCSLLVSLCLILPLSNGSPLIV